MTAGGLALMASALVAAPVLLAACGCGGCGGGPLPDSGTHADAGPPQGDAGPQTQP